MFGSVFMRIDLVQFLRELILCESVKFIRVKSDFFFREKVS